MPSWRLEKWEQSSHLRRLLSALLIDCVFDVGANIGQFHEFLRLHVGYTGRIVSFEPVEELYRSLVDAKARDPRWTIAPLALGDMTGRREINVLRERTLTSFLPRDEANLRDMGYEKYLRETECDRTEVVTVRRLEDVVPEMTASAERLFLKSDTQGYDMHVIRGAGRALERIAALQVELSVRQVYVGSPDYLDGIAELQTLGYDMTAMFPVQRDAAERVVNFDCVMIRRDEAEAIRRRRRGGWLQA
jgi:FkbM family methyltransferase